MFPPQCHNYQFKAGQSDGYKRKCEFYKVPILQIIIKLQVKKRQFNKAATYLITYPILFVHFRMWISSCKKAVDFFSHPS